MWKRHAVYESRPRSVIVSLGGHLYRILEVVPTTVSPKKCPQGSISYCKIYLLHNLFRRGTEGHCNHYNLAPYTFYPTEAGRQGCRQRKKIPSSHHPLMYLNFLNNLSFNRFMTDFHKLSNATSPTIQEAHQDADSANAFPSPLGTQCNGDHFFLRRED
jgi:hypothetical protein